MVNYTVTDLCTQIQASAAAIQAATNAVPTDQKVALLGYTVDGNFVQSPSITTSVTTPATTSGSKLWIIGAVLGSIAFVLLLIGLCCFLHYKCRPRPNNGRITQVHSSNYFHAFFKTIFPFSRLFTMLHQHPVVYR